MRKIQGFGLRDVEARVKVWCFVGKTVAAEKASRFPRSSSYLNQGFLAYILHGYESTISATGALGNAVQFQKPAASAAILCGLLDVENGTRIKPKINPKT